MRFIRRYALDAVAVVVCLAVFVVPFAFIVLTASKTPEQAREWKLSLPSQWRFWSNLKDVLSFDDGLVLLAMKNSFIITFCSVALIVVFGSMVGFVLDRRRDRFSQVGNVLITMGLIIPPAVVPTIYTLQQLHLFKTLQGLVLVEVAFGLPYAIILFRAFASTIPRDLDEAAMIDGCSGLRLFFRVIFPLLRPVTITVIITSSIAIYNDFTNPLYFLPGRENATAQLTLFNFRSQFLSQWNLLFMDALLITVPPFIMFLLFNRRIVDGLAGAVKG